MYIAAVDPAKREIITDKIAEPDRCEMFPGTWLLLSKKPSSRQVAGTLKLGPTHRHRRRRRCEALQRVHERTRS